MFVINAILLAELQCPQFRDRSQTTLFYFGLFEPIPLRSSSLNGKCLIFDRHAINVIIGSDPPFDTDVICDGSAQLVILQEALSNREKNVNLAT